MTSHDNLSSPQLLLLMKRYEIRRQENIQELVYTERSHLHRLKIMKHVRHPLPVYSTTDTWLVSLIPRPEDGIRSQAPRLPAWERG